MSSATVFTHPSQPAGNHGADNERGELIVSFNDIIGDGHGRDFRVVKRLGAGQFGQVFQVIEMNEQQQTWALKVAKSPQRYRMQAEHEVRILQRLHEHADESELELIPELVAHFEFRNHLCMAMDLCSMDLYNVLNARNFVGFPLSIVQLIARQILRTLVLLERAQIVHSDIKPENVVMLEGLPMRVKLIDYGSARTLDQKCSFYVQSRYYRAPEVVLGIPHGCEIDMWSLGCVLFEAYEGCPLFAGQSEVQLLDIIVGLMGQFPEKVVKRSPRFSELFTPEGVMKSEEQVCREQGKLPAKRYKYLQYDNLPDLVLLYERGLKRVTPEVREKRLAQRRIFLDFLLRTLAFAQEDRIKPREALEHPFIVEEME